MVDPQPRKKGPCLPVHFHVFKVLQRKGLQETATKGPFHHHLHEAICHAVEAHVLCFWLRVAKVESIEELSKRKPEELLLLAQTIERLYASSEGVGLAQKGDDPIVDDVFTGAVTYIRDALTYVELCTAMKYGDVGRMELLIPTLLYRFNGGSNPKYTIAFLELIQSMQNEWPEDIW